MYSEENLDKIARFIKKYRIDHSLQQKQLADLAGISTSTLSRIERSMKVHENNMVTLFNYMGHKIVETQVIEFVKMEDI